MMDGIPTRRSRIPLFLLAVLAAVPYLRAQDGSTWAHQAEYRVLAGPGGAALQADVAGFPLLLRLDSATFDFSQARPDGRDIRFESSEGRPFAYQIERWDAAAKRAEVWVRLPLVRAGSDSNTVRMRWGNASAASLSDGRAVFDSLAGFLGAWHLQGATLADAAGRNADGDATHSVRTEGLLAEGRLIQGNNQGMLVPDGPATHAGGALTLSLWMRADSWTGAGRRILQKGGMDAEYALVQEGDSLAFALGAPVNAVVRAPLPAAGAWHHVAATYDGTAMKIHLDGEAVSSAPASGMPAPIPEELGIACRAVQGKPRNNFEGRLDEITLSRGARSADWIRLAFATQKTQPAVLVRPVLPGCPARFAVPAELTVEEGEPLVLQGAAECATRFAWSVVQGPALRILDPEVKTLELIAPRISGNTDFILRFTASFGETQRSADVKVRVRESVPDPLFDFPTIAAWNGRDTLRIRPAVLNRAAVEASRSPVIRYAWSLSGPALDSLVSADALTLSSASADGPLTVGLCMDNGGKPFCRTIVIPVTLPVTILRTSVNRLSAFPILRRDALGRTRGAGRTPEFR